MPIGYTYKILRISAMMGECGCVRVSTNRYLFSINVCDLISSYFARPMPFCHHHYHHRPHSNEEILTHKHTCIDVDVAATIAQEKKNLYLMQTFGTDYTTTTINGSILIAHTIQSLLANECPVCVVCRFNFHSSKKSRFIPIRPSRQTH